nr:hypothetical protein CFP56_31918 [Quercus suber]
MDFCTFSVSASVNRCWLENNLKDGIMEYRCITSETVVEDNKLHGYIENEECVSACGVDRLTIGGFTCEDLPLDFCTFSVSASVNRCWLENNLKDGIMEYRCITSETVVEDNKLHGYIENEECVSACGVDRLTIGIYLWYVCEPKTSKPEKSESSEPKTSEPNSEPKKSEPNTSEPNKSSPPHATTPSHQSNPASSSVQS